MPTSKVHITPYATENEDYKVNSLVNNPKWRSRFRKIFGIPDQYTGSAARVPYSGYTFTPEEARANPALAMVAPVPIAKTIGAAPLMPFPYHRQLMQPIPQVRSRTTNKPINMREVLMGLVDNTDIRDQMDTTRIGQSSKTGGNVGYR